MNAAALKQDEDLAALFRDCSELRAGFNRIEREAEKVRGISMNASVVAGQIGTHMKVFTEVAAQIATAAQGMKNRTQRMRAEVNAIVNLTLRAQVVKSRLDKFHVALPGVVGAVNRRAVDDAMRDGFLALRRLMQEIHEHARPTSSLLKTVMQYQYRMIAALNALKVETVDLTGAQRQAMEALAESLVQTTDSGIASLERVIETLEAITRYAQSIDRLSEQGINDAKVHAA